MGVQIVKLLGSPVSLGIDLNATGEYDNATAYAAGDSVSYTNGNSYVAIQPTTGNLPTDTDYWQLLAEKGATGAQGVQGEQGEQGEPGTNGEDGLVVSVVAGTGISVDDTDPANPIVNNTQTSAEWGSISGTLEDQTDLQTALEDRVPYTGADDDVDLNGNDLLGVGTATVEEVSVTTGDPTELALNPDGITFYNTTPMVTIGATEEDILEIRQGAASSILSKFDVGSLTVARTHTLPDEDGTILTDNVIVDEDNMASDSATQVPTQQSVKAYVDTEIAGVGGGGQTLVTRIVAASGGDHTSLTAALAAASDGDTIYIKSGTYSEAGAISSSLNNLTIIGENVQTSQISAGGNITFSGAGVVIRNVYFNLLTRVFTLGTGDNHALINCKFVMSTGGMLFQSNNGLMDGNFIQNTSSPAGYLLDLQGGKTNMRIVNNYFNPYIKSSGEVLVTSGTGHIISNNSFHVTTTAGAGSYIVFIGGGSCVVSNNSFVNAANSNNVPCAIYLNSTSNTVTANRMTRFVAGGYSIYVGSTRNVVMGNDIDTSNLNTAHGINVNSSDNTVTGNFVRGATGSTAIGINIASGGDNNVLTGNRAVNYNTGINIAASTCDNNVITGNNTQSSTTGIADAGTGTVNSGNA